MKTQFGSGGVEATGMTAKGSGCFPDAKTAAGMIGPLDRCSAQRPDL
jgi:hypothetical protein